MNARPPKSRVRELFAGLLLIACLVVVLTATMWPTPLDKDYGASIVKFLDVVHRNGVPEWFGYNKLEFSANILMFIPIGFLVTLLLPAHVWWLALILCPLVSAGIELTQATLLSSRFATVNDLLANSTGAVIGILCAVILRALVYDRDQKLVARALWENGVRQPVG
ncbi:VanZ family protein [Cryobacterium zongtaii]|uniref:VanZ family protein n=1 Tax=Cryobacterium zongtaii TaxID=1259217 RepID=A0A2S3ZPY4_9MICO|nr:VanZ family protein [Cryobacterium zongtaii]POH70967.1 VanZ family protein [Cryobacterium zongtaii]